MCMHAHSLVTLAEHDIDASGAAHLHRLLSYLNAQPAFAEVRALLPAREAKSGAGTGAAAPVRSTGKYPPLVGAEEGRVVTRFPPEPSGYLHIGHAKAALLNEYYARHYKGKLILRFDDTNPAKEKTEFIDSIQADLARLGIVFDEVTYTSSYFQRIQDVAEKLLKDGKAYIDTSTKEEIKAQRLALQPSPFRDQPLAKNLELWEEMKKGSELGLKCVFRAKIDFANKNGVLRDPNLYRVCLTPHHRTGTKFKVYPTYDMACPVTDSFEGVTHALRSSEYHDRNALWDWVLEATGLRYVRIEDFSRLAFGYTLLSKRKLQWFVDKGLVDGWNDPSFPTVSGLLRRGLSVEALREFVIAQGASKSIVLMEIEKLWTCNKQVIDPRVPRYIAISKANAVPFTLTNAPAGVSTKAQPRHRKNPALGTRMVTYAPVILLEQDDAQSVKLNEEVTLMYWGNAYVRHIERNAAGQVTALQGELHLDGSVKDTRLKLTWLAKVDDLLDIELLDVGALITKESLEKDDAIEQFVNKQLKRTTQAYGDPSLRTLGKSEQIQLERKGYYVIDQPFVSSVDRQLVLIQTPDGHREH